MRYAAKTSATQYDLIGRLKCDRCGKPLSPWFLRRPDVCSGLDVCIRTEEPVLAGWKRERAKQLRTNTLKLDLSKPQQSHGRIQVSHRGQHVVNQGV